MNVREHVAFLMSALPRMQLRWDGFRRVHGQVCKRIDRRRAELGLADLAAYRRRLEEDAAEWGVLEHLCRVTISRFGRDRAIWDALFEEVLPALAAQRTRIDVWSAGCGAGEEPYTLAIGWQLAIAPRWPGCALAVVASDRDPVQLARARAASYPRGTLRELPAAWREAAFASIDGDAAELLPGFRAPVRFVQADLRSEPEAGPFDLIFCRNLAFTYFDEPLQQEVAATLRDRLRDGGALVVGNHERIPDGVPGLSARSRSIYRREL